ncbi:MAG: DUF3883 domain-containing protein [Chloroflexota bacterium]|nr:DUF3883 domain-containing protein [Chloroflexota bacterium]
MTRSLWAEALRAEILILGQLDALALQVRHSGTDRKWDELSRLLQNDAAMFDAEGGRRKLIIFTEHRDTLNYLHDRIAGLLGKPEAIVVIHGGLGREERRKAQELFTQDKDVQILLATDAAGEGVNLQRAHLMVNYDLPWNPNRLEQRFGRIHRIGQTEVCHLWNLVAEETREGDVFKRLFEKLEVERAALGGQVFDVLGRVFGGTPLRDLLLRAIRYGERPEVRAQLFEKVDAAMDREHLMGLIDEQALVRDTMDTTKVMEIREAMERANAARLQPHFVEDFFLEAFAQLGGVVKLRETRRYEVTHVPSVVRARDRQIDVGEPVLTKYERITFEKELVAIPGKPLAAFVCPGHPLLEAVLDLSLERHRELLKRGTILVDQSDTGYDVRALVCIEHAVQDGRTDKDGNRRVISRQMQFVEIDEQGNVRGAGPAPYLDYDPIKDWEREEVEFVLDAEWLRAGDIEDRAKNHAAEHLVPKHLAAVRLRKEEWVERTRSAVHDRLTKEITHWDHRAIQLRQQEETGKGRAGRLNAELAQRRADELQARLQARLAELDEERRVSALPPVVVGGALVVPWGLIRQLSKGISPNPDKIAKIDRIAVDAVLAVERQLGHEPKELAHNHPGYDLESRGRDGRLRFIEVKGKSGLQELVTISKSQVLTALNAPEQFILALVLIDDDDRPAVHYVRRPFQREPDFGAASVNYEVRELLAKAEAPN